MLTRQEAIEIARRVVRENYLIVPPVILTIMFSDKWIELLEKELPGIVLDITQEKYSGKWLVFFHCSWNTDQLGLPTGLMVMVDCNNGRAEIVPKEREEWRGLA